MKALLIVDIQKDFCSGGSLAVPDADSILPLVNLLRRQYPLVVLTQDSHPPDHQSFAANHPGKKVGDVVQVAGLPQVLWPVHCVQGTPGAEFHPQLDVRPEDRIFLKGTDSQIDSYSAFYDNAHLRRTGLGDFLRGAGVDEVHLCGLATDYCVKYSALDALAEGFRTVVWAAGCRGVNLQPSDSVEALRHIEEKGAKIVRSSR